MKAAFVALFVLLATLSPASAADDAGDDAGDATLDILVTFENDGASASGNSSAAPYRFRKRYSIAASARRNATAVAREYSLTEVDHWPIRALSVYCFVYRIPSGQDRAAVLDQLQSDERVESAQPLNQFLTTTEKLVKYNDKYANLQHGLDVLDVSSAHRYSRGAGVRIAIIDSDVDAKHEDLIGRIKKISDFAATDTRADANHGTAVSSIIGAMANNEKGIVGVAPEAEIDLLVACWANSASDGAICDTFTLSKALDQLLTNPPDILNLSLAGPYDPLLARLLNAIHDQGVIIVAADPAEEGERENFPAMHSGVIAVRSSQQSTDTPSDKTVPTIFAPGNQIMVALPDDDYDFRSGSSLAAAHVSGVIALLLAESPNQTRATVLGLLRNSQSITSPDYRSIDACMVLYFADRAGLCPGRLPAEASLKLESGT